MAADRRISRTATDATQLNTLSACRVICISKRIAPMMLSMASLSAMASCSALSEGSRGLWRASAGACKRETTEECAWILSVPLLVIS